MITTKSELKEAIRSDRARYSLRKPFMMGWLFGDENYRIVKYLKIIRKLEFYTNNKKRISNILPYCWYTFRYRRQRVKLGVYIPLNKVGKGLYIPHFGGGIYANCKRMGENCIISSGCVLGNKTGYPEGPSIGNNVEIAIGAKVIGPVSIGDNVIIAPNSVVVKDVPANCVVSGIPAKIIKQL